MTPIEVACRHSCWSDPGTQYNCAAQAGEPCDWSHCDTEPSGVALYHEERIIDAAEFGGTA